MSPKRYTAEEVEVLRRRFTELTAELNAVFDEIAEKVTALSEEMVEGGEPAGPLAEATAQRHDDRSAGG